MMTVGEVLSGSPAEQAGLHPGDHVISIDGKELKDLGPFYQSIIAGERKLSSSRSNRRGRPLGFAT
jgi:C-terminal processing protease CtpA/Prc